MAILFFRGAISIAYSYWITLKSAFDTQRFELLKALHLSLPPNSEIEKIHNQKLTAFLTEEFRETDGRRSLSATLTNI